MMTRSSHIASILIVAMCMGLVPFSATCQKFHFGGQVGLVSSQMDGDNLRGFNHLGYAVSALGGYAFDDTHWLVVELQRVTFGSSIKKETKSPRAEVDLTGYNVMAGYSVRFGDSWDGLYRFRAIVGPRFNSVTTASSPVIEEEAIQKTFVSVTAGLSYFMTPDLMMDLTYTHAIKNILNDPPEGLVGIDKLVPYYINFSVSYYLSKN